MSQKNYSALWDVHGIVRFFEKASQVRWCYLRIQLQWCALWRACSRYPLGFNLEDWYRIGWTTRRETCTERFLGNWVASSTLLSPWQVLWGLGGILEGRCLCGLQSSDVWCLTAKLQSFLQWVGSVLASWEAIVTWLQTLEVVNLGCWGCHEVMYLGLLPRIVPFSRNATFQGQKRSWCSQNGWRTPLSLHWIQILGLSLQLIYANRFFFNSRTLTQRCSFQVCSSHRMRPWCVQCGHCSIAGWVALGTHLAVGRTDICKKSRQLGWYSGKVRVAEFFMYCTVFHQSGNVMFEEF